MRDRITIEQVHQQAERLSKALAAITRQPQPITIEPGSKVNGITWKVYTHQLGHSFPTVRTYGGSIGMTAREAYNYLWHQSTALESATYIVQQNTRKATKPN
ncbi:MAG: hypothetical protein GY930_00380 [bacterium]|nr:hypothetical protein [bacterium]